jgi:ATP-dependent DNA helicase RecG
MKKDFTTAINHAWTNMNEEEILRSSGLILTDPNTGKEGIALAAILLFGKKHLNDSFVMEGDQSISARDKILREIISNILAHRDYANAYTAQFIIEKDKIFTKNSNLPHGHGELQLNKFEPFPKNPRFQKYSGRLDMLMN